MPSPLLVLIRSYLDSDDDALLQLERSCPRGEPTPFVHWRRHFVDRAARFSDYCILLAEEAGDVVGALAAGIKQCPIQGQPLRLAYLFDARTAPPHRRRGIASLLLTEMMHQVQLRGCVGAYGHVVATNRASLSLFHGFEFTRQRQIRYLTYPPFPLLNEVETEVQRRPVPPFPDTSEYHRYDLFSDEILPALAPFDLTHWQSDHGAEITTYNQSLLYQQVPYDDPWPTVEEIRRRGQHWRFFNPQGDSQALQALFDIIRDAAVGEHVQHLSMLIDSQAPIPAFFYEATDNQREYVILTKAFTDEWDGTFGPNLYCDPREL